MTIRGKQYKQRLLHGLCAVWSLCLLCGCRQEVPPAPLPDRPVYLRIHLLSDGRELREPFSTLVVTAPRYMDEAIGLAGVVVVHGLPSGSGGEFYAFDLACPYEGGAHVPIQPMKGGSGEGLLPWICPQCGTVYELALGVGHPLRGPGRYPLKQYRVRVSYPLLEVYR